MTRLPHTTRCVRTAVAAMSPARVGAALLARLADDGEETVATAEAKVRSRIYNRPYRAAGRTHPRERERERERGGENKGPVDFAQKHQSRVTRDAPASSSSCDVSAARSSALPESSAVGSGERRSAPNDPKPNDSRRARRESRIALLATSSASDANSSAPVSDSDSSALSALESSRSAIISRS